MVDTTRHETTTHTLLLQKYGFCGSYLAHHEEILVVSHAHTKLGAALAALLKHAMQLALDGALRHLAKNQNQRHRSIASASAPEPTKPRVPFKDYSRELRSILPTEFCRIVVSCHDTRRRAMYKHLSPCFFETKDETAPWERQQINAVPHAVQKKTNRPTLQERHAACSTKKKKLRTTEDSARLLEGIRGIETEGRPASTTATATTRVVDAKRHSPGTRPPELSTRRPSWRPEQRGRGCCWSASSGMRPS